MKLAGLFSILFAIALSFLSCGKSADYSALDTAIISQDYEKALKIAGEGLVIADDPVLKYKKAEILAHLSGLDTFRVECLSYVMKYGTHLRYYKQRRADRTKLKRDYLAEAKSIYLELIIKKFSVAEDGRDERYFYNALGWIYLSEGDLKTARENFEQSKKEGDVWDVSRALIYLAAEEKRK